MPIAELGGQDCLRGSSARLYRACRGFAIGYSSLVKVRLGEVG